MTQLYLKTIKIILTKITMTTELKNKINLLITDLEEYRDGNNNISDFHIAASLLELKDAICDGVIQIGDTFYVTK